MLKNITNLGDAALYCDFGDKVNIETNSVVIKYFNQIRSLRIDGILNLTPSYNKLIISFDLNLTSSEKLIKIIKNVNTNEKLNIDKKIIEIPICLKDEFSLDLDRLVANLKLNKSAIFKTFLSKNYFCYMTGFIAGMPFLGDVSEKLRVKRLETPRVKVPKGSVGLTEQFCNIYTYESPGGWNIIGNTPLEIFNKENPSEPALINPGDKVKFNKITKEEYDKIKR